VRRFSHVINEFPESKYCGMGMVYIIGRTGEYVMGSPVWTLGRGWEIHIEEWDCESREMGEREEEGVAAMDK